MATARKFHSARIWECENSDEPRSPYERDRDRILYSSNFRRLAGVTQVVSPSEGHVFHNRLTHSLEVAQIAKRLAQLLRDKYPKLSDSFGIIDPDVAEAAALAHDLGHPPFGHVAEHELDSLVRSHGHLKDGYEGNAQAFRIITKLAVRKDWQDIAANEDPPVFPAVPHHEGEFGLNLTRAVLNATLKYPRPWAKNGPASKKWGVYALEQKEFDWVRQDCIGSPHKCIEAAIMDWADDIAYSVHDAEDFYRAGLIPLDRLRKDNETRDEFLADVFRRWDSTGQYPNSDDRDRMEENFEEFCLRQIPVHNPYDGTSENRMALKSFTSGRVAKYANETGLNEDPADPLTIPQRHLDEVELGKQLVWHYVILNPQLATQQYGHRAIIRKLFDVFLSASHEGENSWKILPPRFQERLEIWERIFGFGTAQELIVRNVADAVSSLTDSEALLCFLRLSGISPGSVMDRLPM